jgi:hypothetical protein
LLSFCVSYAKQGGKERDKLARTMRDASSEPGCSCDQEQPCPEDDRSDGSRDVMPGLTSLAEMVAFARAKSTRRTKSR